jgi:hypothetical protein
MSKEAMKLALEALKSRRFTKVTEAKRILEEALAQEQRAKTEEGQP